MGFIGVVNVGKNVDKRLTAGDLHFGCDVHSLPNVLVPSSFQEGTEQSKVVQEKIMSDRLHIQHVRLHTYVVYTNACTVLYYNKLYF